MNSILFFDMDISFDEKIIVIGGKEKINIFGEQSNNDNDSSKNYTLQFFDIE